MCLRARKWQRGIYGHGASHPFLSVSLRALREIFFSDLTDFARDSKKVHAKLAKIAKVFTDLAPWAYLSFVNSELPFFRTEAHRTFGSRHGGLRGTFKHNPTLRVPVSLCEKQHGNSLFHIPGSFFSWERQNRKE
jgi:hypothetical protein